MPVLCRDDRIIHFIHIPKNAGTSVMRLLLAEGWEKPSDLNQDVRDHAHQGEWEVLRERLADKGLQWEYQFAIVRDPYDKLESRYWQQRREFFDRPLARGLADNYEKYARNNLPAIPHWLPDLDTLPEGTACFGTEIDFFNKIAWVVFVTMRDEGWGVDNNHWRPQREFVAVDTHLYKFEQMDDVLSDLKSRDCISTDAELPHLRHRNRATDNIDDPPGISLNLDIDWSISDVADIHKKVLEIYGKDFESFGYSTK